MQISTMRIEDAVVWRKAAAERPDEFATILIDALRRISALKIVREGRAGVERNVAQFIAREALIAAGFYNGDDK